MTASGEFLTKFRESVSNERLDKYRQRGVTGGDENLLVHYAWNIALGESLYPILQCLEVGLRNGVHLAATSAFSSPLWFDTPGLLDSIGTDSIAKARSDLTGSGRPETADRIIAELTFGFWTALFNRRMEQIFWPRIFAQAFPFIPKHIRQRRTIADRLNEVRKLRNRIFHHEPIWYLNDLRDKHARILEMISWTSPTLTEFVRAIDRFPELYDGGMENFKKKLVERLLQVTFPPPTP